MKTNNANFYTIRALNRKSMKDAEEMKLWIEHHKWILQKSCKCFAGFILVLRLVFMIHPVKILNKRSLVEFVSHARRQPAICCAFFQRAGFRKTCHWTLQGRRKDAKNWVTLSAFVKKFGKAASFTQEDTSFGSASPARLWDSCAGGFILIP